MHLHGDMIMRIKRPTIDEIDEIADEFGLNLEFEDIESFQNLMEGPMSSYELSLIHI